MDLGTQPLDKRALLEGDLKIQAELYNADMVEGRTHRIISFSKAPSEITFAWDNINVFTKSQAGKSSSIWQSCRKKKADEPAQSKQILHNVSGVVRPGELLAIMGASGAGKTTLLNALTFRNLDMLNVNGGVYANGQPVHAGHLTAISAYVQQEDLFIGTLTVREVLRFQALLRMQKHFTRKQRFDRVQEVIIELGLSKCADTLVGIPGRLKGISGGEMKRLAFACEVLTDPPLLFCDEPTSGLDCFMAQNVIGVMKALAEKGKTIVATIHQPSSELYAMFDRLLLMAEGRVAYLGDVDGAFDFFSSQGYVCPSNYNPADYFIHTLAIVPGDEETCRRRVHAICDAYEASEEGKSMQALASRGGIDENSGKVASIDDDLLAGNDVYKAGWFAQLFAVVWRSFLSVTREPLILKVRLFQTVMVAVLLGIIYLQQDLSQEGVQNINGALFLFLTNMTFQNAFAVINVFCQELPIFMREHFNGMYRTDVYFLSKMLAELPLFVLYPAIFTVVTYYMIGLNPEFERFLRCMAIVILVSNCACSFGYMISCMSSSITMALSLAPPIIVPFMLFGGFFLNSASVPVYFVWLKWLSWFLYGYESLAINQWDGVTGISCSEHNNATGTCVFQDGASVLNFYNFDPGHMLRDILALVGLLFGYRLIAFFFLLARTMRKRSF